LLGPIIVNRLFEETMSPKPEESVDPETDPNCNKGTFVPGLLDGCFMRIDIVTQPDLESTSNLGIPVKLVPAGTFTVALESVACWHELPSNPELVISVAVIESLKHCPGVNFIQNEGILTPQEAL
jgi:hypothetical protein